MALCRAVEDYLKEVGAKNDKIDKFSDFCSIFSKDEKTARYECYRLWSRLLHHRRTSFKRHDRFGFDKCLKEYLRFVSEEEIVSTEPTANAIFVSPVDFAKYVVKHLDEQV